MKMLDVTLSVREESKTEEKKQKPKYNWDYENNINYGKELIDLDKPLEFKYSQWRTNLSLSNFTDTIVPAYNMNMAYHLSDKLHYQYLFYSVRKVKRYGKKKTEEDKKLEREIKKEQERVGRLASKQGIPFRPLSTRVWTLLGAVLNDIVPKIVRLSKCS